MLKVDRRLCTSYPTSDTTKFNNRIRLSLQTSACSLFHVISTSVVFMAIESFATRVKSETCRDMPLSGRILLTKPGDVMHRFYEKSSDNIIVYLAFGGGTKI